MIIKAGSRDSALAVAQSEIIIEKIRRSVPTADITLITMKTTGDKILDRTLDEVGGKGLFVKELDKALKDKTVDITIHSLKDVPMELPEGLPLTAFSEREDPRDVLVLPKGAAAPDPDLPIGSSSLRRMLQLKKLYPGYRIEPVRGNLQTRLRKLDEGMYGALVLAAAGIKRMHLEDRISRYFSVEEILPAAGQGIIAVQTRAGEDISYLKAVSDPDSEAAALAERAYVRELNGGCTSPVCAYATVSKDTIFLRALYYEEETGQYRTGTMEGSRSEPEELGISLARALRENKNTKESMINER